MFLVFLLLSCVWLLILFFFFSFVWLLLFSFIWLFLLFFAFSFDFQFEYGACEFINQVFGFSVGVGCICIIFEEYISYNWAHVDNDLYSGWGWEIVFGESDWIVEIVSLCSDYLKGDHSCPILEVDVQVPGLACIQEDYPVLLLLECHFGPYLPIDHEGVPEELGNPAREEFVGGGVGVEHFSTLSECLIGED